MSKYVLVLFTAAHLDEAREISTAIVQQRLAACASLIPLVESWYIWEGELEQSSEVKVLLKTTEDCYELIEQFISANHSYDVPEILKIPIQDGADAYLNWVSNSVVSSNTSE